MCEELRDRRSWSPMISLDHRGTRDRLEGTSYPSVFRFLAGQLASAWRSFPAAPVGLDLPALSRRLIDAPIAHDWCCLVAPGRGGETIVTVDVEMLRSDFLLMVPRRVVRVVRDFFVTKSHVDSRWFCCSISTCVPFLVLFSKDNISDVFQRSNLSYCLSLMISWLIVDILLPNGKRNQ